MNDTISSLLRELDDIIAATEEKIRFLENQINFLRDWQIRFTELHDLQVQQTKQELPY